MSENDILKEERMKREYYDLVGNWNLPLIRPGGIADTDQLLEMCKVDENSKVLDVGCGVGFTACRIAKEYGAHVIGIDLSSNMIANAKKRAQKKSVEDLVEFHNEDVTKLPFEDGSFDVVIMESFLNIIGEPEIIQKALEEISRVVRSGGRVGSNEMFAHEETPPELMERIRELLHGACGPGGNLVRYSPGQFSNWFEDAGLRVVQIVKKPAATMRSQLTRSLLKEMGFFGFFLFSIRAGKDVLFNGQLRKATKKAAPVQRIMERNKDTRDYFGYVLIVSQKA